MKKFSIIILALLLCVALVACGRKEKAEPTTEPTTTFDTIPGLDPTIMDPTMDTNIPDPDVNTTMPDYTTGTHTTEEKDNAK